MAQEKKFVTINPGTMPGDGDLAFVLKASTDFGGVTITGANAVTGAVGTLNLVLQNYGTAGTVAGGTIAGMATGTANAWAVDTPAALTVTAANAFIDEGEWVVLKKVESAAANDLTADAVVCVEFVDGIVAVG